MKMVIFGHRRGGGSNPKKSRNYLFLGKIFKFQGGSGPPVPPSGSAHVSQASLLWDIGKQNSPRCDAAERGVPSGAILFA